MFGHFSTLWNKGLKDIIEVLHTRNILSTKQFLLLKTGDSQWRCSGKKVFLKKRSCHWSCFGERVFLKIIFLKVAKWNFLVKPLKKFHGKKLFFSKVSGFWSATLQNLIFITLSFKDFDCEFQNTYFPEQVFVAASEEHISYISAIIFPWVFLIY